jgi:hypothetical protein
MANQAFGTFVQLNQPDPDWINGWGKRGYNWQTSLTIERQLMPNVMVSAGYYRTWFGNFMATDNLRVGPGDFEPYCVTAPTDSRLPSHISGAELCGFYDVVPGLFGQASNLVTLADRYGKHTEVYNGADANFQIRLRDRLMLGGGWNIGNSVQTSTNAGGNASSRTNNCYVVDSPQQAQWQVIGNVINNCDVDIRYQSRVRLNGSYTLPWDFQVAAVFQSNPGPSYNANVTYTAAQVQQSLGRPLAGGTRTVTINVLPQFSAYGPRINQFDLRGSKIVRFGNARLQANVDVYNVLNSSAAVNFNNTYNATWLQPTQILDARLIKFSVQYDF